MPLPADTVAADVESLEAEESAEPLRDLAEGVEGLLDAAADDLVDLPPALERALLSLLERTHARLAAAEGLAPPG